MIGCVRAVAVFSHFRVLLLIPLLPRGTFIRAGVRCVDDWDFGAEVVVEGLEF